MAAKQGFSFFNYVILEKELFFFLMLLHCGFFAAAIFFKGIYTSDSSEYLFIAQNIKEYGISYNGDFKSELIFDFYSLRPPLYGLFILLFKLLINSDFFILLIQNIISIVIWLLITFQFKDEKNYRKIKTLIVTTLILFPTHLILVNSIMADLLLQLWLVLSFLFLKKFLGSGNIKFILLYNIILVLAVFTKPVIMYFWIINVLFSIWLLKTRKNIAVILASLMLPLSVFCWSLRNEQVTGYFHFSSIKVLNLLDINAGSVLVLKKGEEEAKKIKEKVLKEAHVLPNYQTQCDFILSKAKEIIKENPGTYIYAHLKGMLNFFLASGRVDMLEFLNIKPEKEISIIREIETSGLSGIKSYLKAVNPFLVFYIFLIFLWNVFLLVGLIIFVFNRSFDVHLKIFILLLCFYICFVCGPAGYARFKMCILPFMVITAFYFFENIYNKRFQRNSDIY